MPNPTATSAVIGYSVSTAFSYAVIRVVDVRGNVIKEHRITQQGAGSFVFEKGNLNDGVYKYALIIDGKVYDSKAIVITKD